MSTPISKRDTRRTFDVVKRPKHYNSHPAGIECIEVIEHMTLNCGNAVKYLWRAGLKDGSLEAHVQDLKKAMFYVAREIERLGGDPEFRPWDVK